MRGLSYNHLNTVTRGITVPGAGGDIRTVERAFLRRYTGASVGKSCHASHPVREFPSAVQYPVQRTLQQYLGNGEYPLFQSIAMFESSFIQVTRKGKQVFIHNNCNQAIVGIATTNPKLPLPNIMFIARPGVGQVSSGQHREELMLTRLIPLKFVRISIHDSKKQLIKIKLINRRSYYLQLYSSAEDAKALFDCWLSLISLLHHPPRSYLQPYPKAHKTRQSLCVHVVSSEIDTKLDHKEVKAQEKNQVLRMLSGSAHRGLGNMATVFPQQDEVWEEEMDFSTLEKKETKAKLLSQDTIYDETYSKSEDYVIRMRSRLLTSSRRSLAIGLDSFESFHPATPEPSKRHSTSSTLFSDDSDLTLSRCSLPTVQFPEKGESDSVDVVTIFSVFSDHTDIRGGKS